MSGQGGSLQSISIKGRLFPVAADADTGRKIGGYEKEVQANGDGSARQIFTRVPWHLSAFQVDVDDDRGDQEFLQDIFDDPSWVALAATYVGDKVWQGSGTLTGELIFNNQSATATIEAMGRGKLTQQ